MTSHVFRARRVLADRLLGTEPVQRLRLTQAGLAMLLMSVGVVAMGYFAAAGLADSASVAVWATASLGGLALFFALIRSGWSQRLADPSLTLAQMVYAIASGAWAYAIVGAGRGGVFPIVMVILMFGMFQLRPRLVAAVSLYAVLLFGAVMAVMAWRSPQVFDPRVEFGHFLMVATMMPAASLLAGRLSRLRARLRDQKFRLAEALARIQELATRDELTGLVNRRHMQALMEQEHQRCVRSGHTFCLGVLDLDHFKRVNDEHGHAGGDEVLRAVARTMQRAVRVSDVLSRWGGEEFVLLLSDSRAALARSGLDRLREQIEAQTITVGDRTLRVTVSIGLAEHHAGESVTRTLERADGALYEAKRQGRNRVVGA